MFEDFPNFQFKALQLIIGGGEFTAEIAVETILENTAKNRNSPPKTRTRCEPLETLAIIVFAQANLPILAFLQLCDTTE